MKSNELLKMLSLKLMGYEARIKDLESENIVLKRKLLEKENEVPLVAPNSDDST